MTRYVLECPECEARFDLKAYAPEKRVRCRKCRSILSIPYAPGDPAAEAAGAVTVLKPELQAKVRKAQSLRRLAAVAALLLAAALGGLFLLIQRREARLEAIAKPPEEPPLTLETLPAVVPTSGLPLGKGFLWEYALGGGGTEIREVLRAVPGPDGAPEFEVQVRGSSQAGVQTLRAGRDGVRVAADATAGARVEFDAAPLAMPHPLFADSAWSQTADGRADDGARAAWSVEFKAEGVEAVTTPAGTFSHAVRIRAKGTRAGRAVDETLWVQRGTGVVKRSSFVEGRTEEALLRRFVRR
jgi:hypothetical protein